MDMNIYVAFGIFGIISSLLASLADVPLVKPGKPKPEEKLSLNGVNPWWADVSPKRFQVSFWLSFLGQPGGYITMWLLADLIARENETLALVLRVNTFIGCYIGLLCHVVYCMKPLLYQKLSKKMSDSESLEVIKAIDPMIKVPMVIGFLSLWLGGTIIMIIAVVTGALAVPMVCVLLNPIVALLVLMVVKKCGIRITGSLGVGFMLFSILLIIAGINV